MKRAGGALVQHLAIDHASARTISSQLAAGLRNLILEGALKPGDRLPATRTLAGELSIARSTVVEAFEQLISEGLLETQVGSGSFVSKILEGGTHIHQTRPAPAPRTARPERLAVLMDAAATQFARRITHAPRAFTTAMAAFDAFPVALWSRIVAKHWRGDRAAILGYNDPLGHRPLRQAIAQHVRSNRGISCDWTQVFVFPGAQQAFQVIASVLLDPGDEVWFENPGAIGARNSFVIQGAKVVPVPVDNNGIRVDMGLLRAPGFRLAFVTPAHQQPLGAKMSADRRMALLQAAGDASAWIVEDDWDGDFCFAGRPQPALKSIDAADRVVYVGTFSKSLFPSLRLGYLIAPQSLTGTFEMALGAFSSGVPTSLQAAVAEFMDEGHFAAHIRRMRRLYAERHNALVDAARAELAPWVDIQTTTIGLHTIGYLKGGLRGRDVAEASEKRQLTVAPISRFCIEPHTEEGLVLGFSGIPVPRITTGVHVLAEVLEDLAKP
ncbi:MAG: MocR-like pyridoxine biosynthesis transcription factor PdxR [Devosia sp.]